MSFPFDYPLFLDMPNLKAAPGAREGGRREEGGARQITVEIHGEPRVLRAGQSFPVLGLWV